MNIKEQFKKIRPYLDPEVNDAILRITNNKDFLKIISFVYPDKDANETLTEFKEICTVRQFQSMFSHKAVNKILELTSDGLTFSGLENLDKSQSYVFVANHRDIVLDSAILQVILHENGHNTTQITFGSNLMSDEMIIDLGKLNKMFTFYRGGSKLQVYKNALLHSSYIRHVVTEQKESVWIAQRDGRTKNGDDQTQPALIKMLTAGRKDILKALLELNIVPVATSYEFEPCEIQKAIENYISGNEVYTKKPGEDFESIIEGILCKKGRVHVSFGTPINNILEELKESSQELGLNDLANMVADEISSQIYAHYKLWPNNYIAWDMLKNKTAYLNDKYSAEERNTFERYFELKSTVPDYDKNSLIKLLVEMYAMPLINYKREIASQKATM